MTESIIPILGGTTVAIAAIAWLARSLVLHLLSKDIEKFRIELEHTHSRSIEAFKSLMELEAQRQIIEFGSLHQKRAGLIAELYQRAVDLHSDAMRLGFELGRREVRLEQHHKSREDNNEPWTLTPGIDSLSDEEEEKVNALEGKSKEFFTFYSKNRIYFSTATCDLIDSFANLSGYAAIMYKNVAIKDYDGELMVNPLVREVWEKALNKIPELLKELEGEFRELLGVTKNQPNNRMQPDAAKPRR